MKYCSRCLYPANHPLYITFDDKDVCSGCRIHEEKDQIDWQERLETLKKIVAPYKVTLRSIHDCIIPVSGARDSYFIVHVVKNILGLNPLLVTYNKQYNTQVGIRNLAYLRTKLGCDIMTMTVSPDRIKKITKESLRQRGSIYWHCIAGQTAFPVQIAVKFKIPLIIWGAHQGIDQVGMFSHLDEVEMTRKYREEHDLMCLEAEDLLINSNGKLVEEDIEQFCYPYDEEIAAVGVRGLYLNNYFRWDSKSQHELMIKMFDYETTKQQRTFDCYNDVDCFHYSGIHDYIKYLKWGYAKVTDHACREIRLKRLSRNEGIDLVSKYHNKKPKDLTLFLNWLDISEFELWSYINKFRDTTIWKKSHDNEWTLLDSILNHRNDPLVNEMALEKIEKCHFTETKPKAYADEVDKYTLVGRGWVDVKTEKLNLKEAKL